MLALGANHSEGVGARWRKGGTGVEDCNCLPLPGLQTRLTIGRITYRFRTHFVVETNLAGFNLSLATVVDDGAIIYLNGAILGISQAEMKRREDAIIDFSELGNFIDMPVKYYSSGMFSRLAFSIAVMADPQILIVDEILAAGDAHFVNKATERMKDLFKNSQIVLLVSHSVNQIANLCNEVVVMNKGEVVARGETDAMLKYYQDEIVNQGNG